MALTPVNVPLELLFICAKTKGHSPAGHDENDTIGTVG
jgi:hypothetical protein